jgi:hypothetical protein
MLPFVVTGPGGGMVVVVEDGGTSLLLFYDAWRNDFLFLCLTSGNFLTQKNYFKYIDNIAIVLSTDHIKSEMAFQEAYHRKEISQSVRFVEILIMFIYSQKTGHKAGMTLS